MNYLSRLGPSESRVNPPRLAGFSRGSRGPSVQLDPRRPRIRGRLMRSHPGPARRGTPIRDTFAIAPSTKEYIFLARSEQLGLSLCNVSTKFEYAPVPLRETEPACNDGFCECNLNGDN